MNGEAIGAIQSGLLACPTGQMAHLVHHVEAKAGDCILFTEKLKHGTIPWSGKNERRTLFYKYVPFGMHHGDAGYTTDPELTKRQRRILEFYPSWFNEPREDKDYSSNPALTKLHPLAQLESDPSVLQAGMAPPHLRLTEEKQRAMSEFKTNSQHSLSSLFSLITRG